MRWRLEAVDADLAVRLAAAEPAAQRRMARAAALSAVEFTGLAGPDTAEAAHALDTWGADSGGAAEPETGDSGGAEPGAADDGGARDGDTAADSGDAAVRRAAEVFATGLTDRYWDAHDAWAAADDEVSSPRPPDTDLDRSSAAHALAEALNDDPRAAALDAVYYAAIAVGGLRVLQGLMRPRLKG